MVLFENVQAFNSRSETLSVFKHNPFGNCILFFGTIIVQLVHIAAMYTPGIRDVLELHAIKLDMWFSLFFLAIILLVAMEMHKKWLAYSKTI